MPHINSDWDKAVHVEYDGAVSLPDVEVDDFILRLQNKLFDMGFDEPYVIGGAARSQIDPNHPLKDYDVKIDVRKSQLVDDRFDDDDMALARHAEKTIIFDSDFENAVVKVRFNDNDGTAVVSMQAQFEGRDIDLNFVTKDVNRFTVINASTYIQSVGIDPHGNVFAHSRFMDHFKNGIYQPATNDPDEVAALKERFERVGFAERYGWKYVEPDENATPASGVSFKRPETKSGFDV